MVSKKPDSNIEFESFSTIVKQGLIIIFIFFFVLGIWSIFGKINGAVVVPGIVKIDTERKKVQHLEGGIIDKILVREGEHVQQGQALILLKSALADSNVDMVNKNLILYLAARNRYEAEKNNFSEIKWDKELLDLIQKYKNSEVLHNEVKSFEARYDSYQSKLKLFDSQIKQLSSQIMGMREELDAENAIIRAFSEELLSKRALVKQKYLEKTQVLSLERDIAMHKGRCGQLRQSIAASEQQREGLQIQKEALVIELKKEAANNINQLDSKIIQAREQLQPLQDTKERLQIVAPVSGKIVGLQVHSAGGVIAPGQELMDIVPENSPMIAEVHIPVDKIADVYLGQEAQAQLDAFDRTTPLIAAKVVHIAADRQEEQTGMGEVPFYLSYIQLFPESINNPDIYISPGMPITAFITTKKKTILYYILEPLIKSWDMALRE